MTPIVAFRQQVRNQLSAKPQLARPLVERQTMAPDAQIRVKRAKLLA
jgi:hypothetical protein